MKIDEEKANLRATMRERRRVASENAAGDAAMQVIEPVMAILDVLMKSKGRSEASQVIAGYRAVGNELSLAPLLRRLNESGWVTVLPVVLEKDMPLTFKQWRPGDKLVKGPYKTLQPEPEKPVAAPDVLLVPLLAFDNKGYRLGQGGGFYDRTLAKLQSGGQKPLAIGIAFAAQGVETVPRDAFDRCLDWIVTEEGARHFGTDS